mmetsp:Transcript_58297/g.185811  ORF Transcript_58297/g.185811 Transcript_58297/m.185811 type:complete len:152 (-) Transcript_58297:899-1354(-)
MEVVEASEAPTMIQEKMCVVHEHPPEPPPETPEQKPTQSHASDDDHSDDGVSLLPRHTKVLVTGNNRTKSSLVGLRGVVKKAVGLGGWHWLVLSNGDEVRLQRNALSVLEQPTGEEEYLYATLLRKPQYTWSQRCVGPLYRGLPALTNVGV